MHLLIVIIGYGKWLVLLYKLGGIIVIKIAYILLHLGDGGTETFVANVIEQLDKTKYDVTIILASNEEHGFLEDRMRKAGAKIYKTVYVSGIKNKLIHLRMVYKILKDNGPFHIVHGNIDLFNGLELAVAKKANVPIRICHSHNSSTQNANTILSKLAFNIYKPIMNHLIWKYSTVHLGCSDKAMNYLYGVHWENYKDSKVIFNGIKLDKFRNPNIDKEEYSKKIGIDPNKMNLLTVGRLVSQKNPLFILDIVYELSKIRDNFVFNWVGDGAMKKDIYKKVKELNIEKYIKFFGARSDVSEIMKCCDCFILPSLFEGLAFVIIEAQCAGLECFISNTVSHLANCGKCEVLPINKGAKVWAYTINDYIDSKKEFMINKELLSKFDIKNTVKQLEEFYCTT